MEPEPDILDAITRAGLQRRGTLREWMIANRDAFARKLTVYKPDWQVLAKVFADAGLLDQRGNPPTAEAARKTWQRLNKEAKAGPPPKSARAGRSLSTPPLPPQTLPGGHSDPDSDDGEPKIVLKRVTRQQ
jgi:hypothetical protein